MYREFLAYRTVPFPRSHTQTPCLTTVYIKQKNKTKNFKVRVVPFRCYATLKRAIKRHRANSVYLHRNFAILRFIATAQNPTLASRQHVPHMPHRAPSPDNQPGYVARIDIENLHSLSTRPSFHTIIFLVHASTVIPRDNPRDHIDMASWTRPTAALGRNTLHSN